MLGHHSATQYAQISDGEHVDFEFIGNHLFILLQSRQKQLAPSNSMKSAKKGKVATIPEECDQSFYDPDNGSTQAWPADEAPQDRFNGEWQNSTGSKGKMKQNRSRQKRTPSPRSDGIESL